MSKKLTSIFTDDMNTCYFQKRCDGIERHHVFGGPNRKKSEKYGFVIPLHYTLHPNGAGCELSHEERKALDLFLKQVCERWYLENVGSIYDWIQEFGKSYL